MRIKALDVFAISNLILFGCMCFGVYYPRFVSYMGEGRLAEFLFYAFVTACVVVIGWLYFRQYAFSPWCLGLVELGILMHFAGGIVSFGGARLYDHVFFCIRFDKYVHFTNAMVASLIVQVLFHRLGVRIPLIGPLVVVLVVLGAGSLVEIVEYWVTRNLPDNGVGGYDNNMHDLIANLAGGVVGTVCGARYHLRCIAGKG